MSNEVSRRRFVGVGGAALGLSVGETLLAQAQGEAGGGKKIKIVGVSCSPRKGRSTAEALGFCLAEARKVSDAIETELIELAGLKIPGQVAVGIPLDEGERDDFPEVAPKLSDPSVAAIILGTPVYFGNMTYLCKAFLDRWMVFRQNNFALSGKIGAVLAVGGSRNGGQELTLQSVQAVLMAHEMLIVGEGRPTAHWGGTLWSKDDSVAADEFGLTTARNLGKRVAEVALRVF